MNVFGLAGSLDDKEEKSDAKIVICHTHTLPIFSFRFKVEGVSMFFGREASVGDVLFIFLLCMS